MHRAPVLLATLLLASLRLDAQPVDRTRPPRLAPPTPVTMPTASERTLPNGLRLLVVPQPKLPLLDAVLLLRHGAEADPAGKEGLAALTATLLREGTATRTSPDIADQQAFLGVRLGSSASLEQTTITLHTPTAVLDSAFALMADLVLHPSFPDAEFSRVRSETLTGLLQLRDRAPAIADRAFAAIVFGDAHPYGRPTGGTETSVEAITRADVAEFWRTWYRPNAATLILVGDITVDEAERRARALFGAWERGPLPTLAAAPAPAPARTGITLIDKPGAPQSSFRLGSVAVARNTPDYHALMVLNTVLGGSFTSRLNNNLRETKGYTYGAGSSFGMRREAGPFTARAEIVAEKSDSALLEFMRELRAIREPLDAAELEKAKQYLILGFAERFETTGDVASQYVPLVTYGLPLDTWSGFQRGVERVTADDVQRVARQYVNPEALHIVIVGDRASIEAPLRATGVAPLQLRDAMGRPVPTP
jgi:predicted Zn-dependent peptidase